MKDLQRHYRFKSNVRPVEQARNNQANSGSAKEDKATPKTPVKNRLGLLALIRFEQQCEYEQTQCGICSGVR